MVHIDDVEMNDSVDSLRNFIVCASEDSVSNGGEEISDSDSGEGDNGNQEAFREEIVTNRHNLIWEFGGTCLRPCKTILRLLRKVFVHSIVNKPKMSNPQKMQFTVMVAVLIKQMH